MSTTAKDSGHYANYVGPYRLEKTLGKGQTVQMRRILHERLRPGRLSRTPAICGHMQPEKIKVFPSTSTLPTSAGDRLRSALVPPFCRFVSFCSGHTDGPGSGGTPFSPPNGRPVRTDGPVAAARADELRCLKPAASVKHPIMWHNQIKGGGGTGREIRYYTHFTGSAGSSVVDADAPSCLLDFELKEDAAKEKLRRVKIDKERRKTFFSMSSGCEQSEADGSIPGISSRSAPGAEPAFLGFPRAGSHLGETYLVTAAVYTLQTAGSSPSVSRPVSGGVRRPLIAARSRAEVWPRPTETHSSALQLAQQHHTSHTETQRRVSKVVSELLFPHVASKQTS
ncbi:hypothetical protein L3Q82_000046 [Scortum barcoo]|uniref:Uncharacterized protein n=1 Tax=Scortum barcoo TaxID=214431 RepID=A0ACB8XBV6_9TELE|nr:hypothetical protein L3Q82_000046 [Scortum barcoo]